MNKKSQLGVHLANVENEPELAQANVETHSSGTSSNVLMIHKLTGMIKEVVHLFAQRCGIEGNPQPS